VRAHFELGNENVALQTVDQAVVAIPDDPHMTAALAELCLGHGQARKARFMFEEVNDSNPGDPNTELLLARASLQAGEPKEALAVLRNVSPEAGRRGETMFLRGEAQALTGNLVIAEVDLSAAVEADPHNLRYLMAYAWLEQRERRYKEALTTLEKARELDAQMPVIPFRMAVSYFFLDLDAQAVLACEDALRLDPRYAEAFLLLGTAKLQQQDFEAARLAFQNAVALKPEVALFHLLLGTALYKGRSFEESRKELDKALTLDPQEARAYFYRALVFSRQGERRKAIADLETVVALRPHYRKAYVELARLYRAEGQLDKATVALAKESVERKSEETESERMLQELGDLPDEIR
jgi:tetratricopeptide (TPR) repeat protein